MKEFKAKKGNFWIYIVLSVLFPIIILLLNYEGSENYWFIIPAILPLIVFLWIYFSTKYYIKGNEFFYRSAFLKGKIEISKITSIQNNKTLWAGVKPALATKGMIIKYGYDELYVAPEDNEELIKAFLEINPSISVN